MGLSVSMLRLCGWCWLWGIALLKLELSFSQIESQLVFKIFKIYPWYNCQVTDKAGNDKQSLAIKAKMRSKWSLHFLCVQLIAFVLFSPMWLWILSSDVHGVLHCTGSGFIPPTKLWSTLLLCKQAFLWQSRCYFLYSPAVLITVDYMMLQCIRYESFLSTDWQKCTCYAIVQN